MELSKKQKWLRDRNYYLVYLESEK